MSSETTEKKASEIILERLSTIEKQLNSLESLKTLPNTETTPKHDDHTEATKGHATLDEIIACPNCYPKLRDLVLKKEEDENTNKPYVCTTCGKGVELNEPTCPKCGGKFAKPR